MFSRGIEIDQWYEMGQSKASDIFLSLKKAGSKAPTFTDLAELVSQIRPPGTVSQATLAKISRIFDYYSDEDISDNDEMDFRERGVMSDQELMPESDLMSGTEELGYEVCQQLSLAYSQILSFLKITLSGKLGCFAYFLFIK